jgi:SAM-dependent methyltransferase
VGGQRRNEFEVAEPEPPRPSSNPNLPPSAWAAPAALEEIRAFWDADAPTYDDSPSHRPRNAAVVAAWAATLGRLLPPAPARVLDAGAGTGFLSLIAARLGHVVTALDLSPQMLACLEESARAEHLEVATFVGPADEPTGEFDAVVERHVIWTLPDPVRAISAWRRCAPAGRLVLFESVWGGADPLEAVRSRIRKGIKRVRGARPDHHGSYRDELRRSLPFGNGTPPESIVETVLAAGWRNPRLERLNDVEWAERRALAPLDRLAGVSPRFAIAAD